MSTADKTFWFSDGDSSIDSAEGIGGDGIPNYGDGELEISIIRLATDTVPAGDYTTYQAWEDYAGDQTNASQWAEVQKSQGHSFQSFGSLSVSDWASTPTINNYPRLYTSENSRHEGNIGRAVIIAGCNIGVSFFRLEQIASTDTIKIDTGLASNVHVDSCIAAAGDAVSFECCAENSSSSSDGNIFTNCLSLGNLNGTSTSGPDWGFKLGGNNMQEGALIGVSCINCASYDQFGSGFSTYNVSVPGESGGGNVRIQNCIAADADGSDYSFSSSGSGGSITTTHNMSSDSSALDNGDNLSTHLTQRASQDIWVNPLRSGSLAELGEANFRLEEDSDAIDVGLIDISTPTKDITNSLRVYNNLVDMGPFEWIIPPSIHATLFISGGKEAIRALFISGHPGAGELTFNHFNLLTISRGLSNDAITLVTGGPVEVTNSMPLYITSRPTEGLARLYISGKIDIFNKALSKTLFILAKGAHLSSDLIIGGCRGDLGVCPDIQDNIDEPFIPFNGQNPTLYLPGESKCFGFLSPNTEDSSAVKPKYLLEDNLNDSSSADYDWSVSGTISYTQDKAQGNKAILFPNGSTSSSPNLASISHSNTFFDSSGEGIAVSFWIKRISEYTSSPSVEAGVITEGVITKSSLLNETGPNIAGINGDWGIFKTNDSSYPDIVFYANVDDVSIQNTIELEGFSPETGSWYFVMYWIDAENKRSYFRYVKAPIFSSQAQLFINVSDASTVLSQQWQGDLQSNKFYTATNLMLGYNEHGLGGSSTGFLGETYGDSWAIDEIMFSNQICSKSAMESVFNTTYKNALYSVISESFMSLYIPGPPEHTGYNEEDLLL